MILLVAESMVLYHARATNSIPQSGVYDFCTVKALRGRRKLDRPMYL